MKSWFVNIVFLIILLGILMVGQEFYKENPEQDIYKITNNLSWNKLNISFPQYECSKEEETCENIININRIKNIIYKTADYYGYVLTEVFRWGVETGFHNPQYNYYFFFTLIRIFIYGLIAWIIGVPLLVILYLVYKLIKSKRRRTD